MSCDIQTLEFGEYRVEATQKASRPGCWDILDVSIFKGETEIGKYERGYPSLFNTFLPFVGVDGEQYALYSADYTCTRVMKLPSCEDWCGEEPNGFGFCPTGYHIPLIESWEDPNKFSHAPFGFVSGCVWGDDGSWKVEFLDLSKIPERQLKRESKFGYAELLGGSKELPLMVRVDDENDEEDSKTWTVEIAVMHRFRLDKNFNLIGGKPVE